jgi:hypothetical protein
MEFSPNMSQKCSAFVEVELWGGPFLECLTHSWQYFQGGLR